MKDPITTVDRIVSAKEKAMALLRPTFFGNRGNLALSRDVSQHRRYSYLYEDLCQ